MATRDHPDWWTPVGGLNATESLLERGSTVMNDGGVITWGNVIDDVRQGKFFPRGMRGHIWSVGVYCRDNAVVPAGGTITVYLAPYVGCGQLLTAAIAVPVGGVAAWRAAIFDRFWNYDGMFIWVVCSNVDIQYALDFLDPRDGWTSTDSGAIWAAAAIRPWFRVYLYGETAGDVPVSGTLNTIEIPSVSSELTTGVNPNFPHAAWTTLFTGVGAGTMLEARLLFETSVAPTAGIAAPAVRYAIDIYADGVRAYLTDNRQICQSEVATAGRSSAGEFWQTTVAEPAYDRTMLAIRIPIQFRRSIRVDAFQSSGGIVPASGSIHVSELR